MDGFKEGRSGRWLHEVTIEPPGKENELVLYRRKNATIAKRRNGMARKKRNGG